MDKLKEHLHMLKDHVNELESLLSAVKCEINTLQDLIFELEDNNAKESDFQYHMKDEIRRIFYDIAVFKE